MTWKVLAEQPWPATICAAITATVPFVVVARQHPAQPEVLTHLLAWHTDLRALGEAAARDELRARLARATLYAVWAWLPCAGEC